MSSETPKAHINPEHNTTDAKLASTSMTPVELATLLDMHIDSVYRALNRGEIPGAIKVGRRWRILSKVFWKALEMS